MTGNWNNDQAYYRCQFPAEYALANRVDHPKTVYLREADVIGQLDTWLGQVFGPWITETQAQRVAAQAESRSTTGQRARACRPGTSSPGHPASPAGTRPVPLLIQPNVITAIKGTPAQTPAQPA